MTVKRGCRPGLEPFSVQIPWPVKACTDALLSGPSKWFPRLDEKNVGVVGVEIAGFPVRKRVVVDLGTPTRTMTWTVIPLRWTATFPSRLFPRMVGRIEVAPVDSRSSRLTVSGKYQAPLGRLGKRADDAFLRRLADSTIEKLAESIALRIDAALAALPESAGSQGST